MTEEADIRVLLVEDEAHIAAGLKLNLELEGYLVDVARTGREAGEFLLSAQNYGVIILDVMLPDTDGFTICRRLRGAGIYVPVIMLTAKASATDRVDGLDAGADDYISKPFELSELLARVRSRLRRQAWDTENQASQDRIFEMVLGPAKINFDTYEVYIGEEQLQLTHLELDLLRYFAENPGRVLKRDELLEKVWKLKNYPNTRTVDNFIVRLRKHFEEDPANPKFFVSVRGAGYKFVPLTTER